jgi:hypothetical protein
MFDPTPGAATANSYVSSSEADDYFDERLGSSAWKNATDTDKESALMLATALLDSNFVWTGQATTEEQALGWYRTGMLTRNGFPIDDTLIPRELKVATLELALHILANNIFTPTAVDKGIKRLKASSAEIEYFQKETDGTVASVSSLTIPDYIRALLVPSWWDLPLDLTVPRVLFETL